MMTSKDPKEESVATADVVYALDGKCFKSTKRLPDIDKKSKTSITIHNASDVPLRLHCIVLEAKKANGDPIPAADLDPFVQPFIRVRPRATEELRIRMPHIGIGDGGDIVGRLMADGGCAHAHDAADQFDHTDWHINC